MSDAATPAPSPWAWAELPLGDRAKPGRHNAQAKSPLTAGWNLPNFRNTLRWFTAQPDQGDSFGVILHDANPAQLKSGVGYAYYVPTAEDLAIVHSLFPDRDPGNPPWNQIETALVLAGMERRELRSHNAATLIRLLQRKNGESDTSQIGAATKRSTERGKAERS